MRPLQTLHRLLSSRAVAPLVLALFLLLYIGVAFVSDEALIMVMELTRTNPLLLGLLMLLPVNGLLRLRGEAVSYWRRRRLFATGGNFPALLFDEEVTIPAAAPLADLQERLGVAGYATRSGENSLAAWRGISSMPLRLLCLAGMVLLSGGIMLSLTGRNTVSLQVIEGELLEWSPGRGDRVERITLKEQDGVFLGRTLEIALRSPGGEGKTVGLYPPVSYHGRYLYPRYLGIAPLVRFSAPDLPGGVESHFLLAIYPPGKEDRAAIPGTPYRLGISLAPDSGGDDPFISGRMTFTVKLYKGEQQLGAGTVPLGGELRLGGCRVGFAGFRRYVATDFVRDGGFLPIWAAILCYLLAFACWLPLRLLSPRREMFFRSADGVVHASSFAEGGGVRHGAVFHDALDFLVNGKAG